MDERPQALSVGQKAGGALLAGVLLLAGTWLFSQRTMERLVGAVGSVEHTYVLLRAIGETETSVSTAEAGARGYALTGDSAYVTGFERARVEVIHRLDTLAGLAAADSVQSARLERLRPVVERRFAALDQLVAARRGGGLSAASAATVSAAGRQLSDSVRAMIDVMEEAEDRRLGGHSIAETVGASRSGQVVTGGLLLTVVISLLAAVGVARDIGRRAEASRVLSAAKEEAEAASRAKSDFLARMSHELRTPLNSIIGFSNVLLKNRGGALRPQDALYLQRIVANGRQLLALINDILDLSKVEAGRMQLDIAVVELGELVTDMIAGFEGQLHEREGRVEIVAELPRELAPIETDAVKLQQVLLNLIGNALKFTEAGRVTVRAVAEPGTGTPLRIEVLDTGVGIPPERREAVFEAFEQADPGVARRYGGTGLGLAIARSLCTALGYGLTVGDRPGGGSVFAVVLAGDAPPAAPGASGAGATATATASAPVGEPAGAASGS